MLNIFKNIVNINFENLFYSFNFKIGLLILIAVLVSIISVWIGKLAYKLKLSVQNLKGQEPEHFHESSELKFSENTYEEDQKYEQESMEADYENITTFESDFFETEISSEWEKDPEKYQTSNLEKVRLAKEFYFKKDFEQARFILVSIQDYAADKSIISLIQKIDEKIGFKNS